ncbi:MAG: peptidylprolyl isomerase [Candidatus Dactylopiibacterium carminicum]|uniref:peptidylprolyl isomerase n=1 Tax=Candidatus Dactylopiibacterium carminicum TaxID=857335 RepID=A0A272ET41_9RHOO|nr:peptidylprolyl isomerase [Candidatus Dactylopiibacterium carminicum]KAF7599156.1 peptidylprolyl isomerase [Candidatus Dactylopiibacterium carminicum]PAS93272.1 MAG: peptidylprolyl isomerase [Candidatus Dactylopiibacterium carminicum]PAS99171.1 MAG: peptidylprolyl isomerase [Candidatus Dactylopiibacterium carminicum]
MKISKNTAVTLSLRVSDANGRLIDDGKRPVAYLHGGYDNLFPVLEAALEGQEPGFQTTLALSAADAFGERDESLLQTMPKAEFPPGIKVGGQIERLDTQGEPRHFFVTKIKGPVVLLDGNHPLAGQALRFTLQVLAVREASEEEITHQHVHGEHGHHH